MNERKENGHKPINHKNKRRASEEEEEEECSRIQGQFLWKLPEPWKPHLPIWQQQLKKKKKKTPLGGSSASNPKDASPWMHSFALEPTTTTSAAFLSHPVTPPANYPKLQKQCHAATCSAASIWNTELIAKIKMSNGNKRYRSERVRETVGFINYTTFISLSKTKNYTPFIFLFFF